MQLHCGNCAAEIQSEHINIDRLLAKCTACNAVFSFDGEIDSPTDRREANALAIPTPQGFTVENRGYELQITRQWFGLKYILLTVFAIVWDGMLVLMYSMALSLQFWPIILFGLVHAVAGICLTYAAVAGYVNRTVISVSPTALTIRHGPLPWPGNATLSPAQITQLYCKERIRRNKGTMSYTYAVHAVTLSGRDVPVLRVLESPEQALYLEHEIERFLGIEDRPVRGELSK